MLALTQCYKRPAWTHCPASKRAIRAGLLRAECQYDFGMDYHGPAIERCACYTRFNASLAFTMSACREFTCTLHNSVWWANGPCSGGKAALFTLAPHVLKEADQAADTRYLGEFPSSWAPSEGTCCRRCMNTFNCRAFTWWSEDEPGNRHACPCFTPQRLHHGSW